jgi:hypothetical protein
MSRYAENLGRAARMLKRLDDIGGPSEVEGVSLKEIVADVLEAQNRAFLDEAIERLESPLPENVVSLVDRIGSYSRRIS